MSLGFFLGHTYKQMSSPTGQLKGPDTLAVIQSEKCCMLHRIGTEVSKVAGLAVLSSPHLSSLILQPPSVGEEAKAFERLKYLGRRIYCSLNSNYRVKLSKKNSDAVEALLNVSETEKSASASPDTTHSRIDAFRQIVFSTNGGYSPALSNGLDAWSLSHPARFKSVMAGLWALSTEERLAMDRTVMAIIRSSRDGEKLEFGVPLKKGCVRAVRDMYKYPSVRRACDVSERLAKAMFENLRRKKPAPGVLGWLRHKLASPEYEEEEGEELLGRIALRAVPDCKNHLSTQLQTALATASNYTSDALTFESINEIINLIQPDITDQCEGPSTSTSLPSVPKLPCLPLLMKEDVDEFIQSLKMGGFEYQRAWLRVFGWFFLRSLSESTAGNVEREPERIIDQSLVDGVCRFEVGAKILGTLNLFHSNPNIKKISVADNATTSNCHCLCKRPKVPRAQNHEGHDHGPSQHNDKCDHHQ